jgi:hypothetical protein
VPRKLTSQLHARQSLVVRSLAVALVGCSDGGHSSRLASESASAHVSSAQRDSTWVDVRGPTLIAFVGPTSTADSGNADLAEALGDFSYHLGTADSSLRSLGFRITVLESRRFYVVRGARVDTFTVPKDSADIGYYLVAPARAPAVSYGVQTNSDLIDAARHYIQVKARGP